MRVPTIQPVRSDSYSLEMIQDEVRCLLEKQLISRQQPIYILCQYIPAREWIQVEQQLEKSDYLLRDAIGDLLGTETWESD